MSDKQISVPSPITTLLLNDQDTPENSPLVHTALELMGVSP